MLKAKKRQPVIDALVCAACGECAETCPRLAISVPHGVCAVVDYARCLGCGLCAAACPAAAIDMRAVDPETPVSGTPLISGGNAPVSGSIPSFVNTEEAQ